MKQHHISLLLIWRSIPKIILILSNFGWRNDHMLILCSWLCMVTVVDDVSHTHLVLVIVCKVFMEPPVRCSAHIPLSPPLPWKKARGPICKHPPFYESETEQISTHYYAPSPPSSHDPSTGAFCLPSSKEVVSHPALFLDCMTHTLSKYIVATIWVGSLLNCARAFPLHILYMRLYCFISVCLSCFFTGTLFFKATGCWNDTFMTLLSIVSHRQSAFNSMKYTPKYVLRSLCVIPSHLLIQKMFTNTSQQTFLLQWTCNFLLCLTHFSSPLWCLLALGGQHAVVRYWKLEHQESRRLGLSCFQL